MKLKHPSVDKLWPVPFNGSTVLLQLSPESIGRIGGEMAGRMLASARSYLEEITILEVKKAFYKEILKDLPEGVISLANINAKQSGKTPPPPQTNGVGAHANQYPGDTGLH